MARRNGAAKVAEWRERMRRFERSGISIARFCQEEGVSAANFYQWRRRLQHLQDPQTAQASSPSRAEAEFAAVRIVGGGSITVTWPGGIQMELPMGDQRLVTAVVATINAHTARA